MKTEKLRNLLDEAALKYNSLDFITLDPISIPHLFKKPQDIEIAGFFASVLAWGQRSTIINNCKQLMQWMDHAPHQFIKHHTDEDLKPFLNFKHRTFNATDLLYFMHFLQHYYNRQESLEHAFAMHLKPKDSTIENALIGFHDLFFNDALAPLRTRKHIPTPKRKSACKRLNMYLRWMVRQDKSGVDFGLWKKIKPSQLICPIDVHVERMARRYGLITRRQVDWECALELTRHLKKLDAKDPVKYDFALFGLSVMNKTK